jgi:hypothetical protein
MSVFSGLADVVTGVVFIIGGIVNGSWTDVWTGMKLIAFGVIDAIIGVVLELVGAIAGAVDSLMGLVGKSSNLQASVQGFKDKVHGDMAKAFGVDSLTFTQKGATKPLAVALPAPPATGAMPAVAALPGQPAATQLPVYGPPPPPAPVTVNLQLDGQTIATAVHKAQADNAARAFSPLPAF